MSTWKYFKLALAHAKLVSCSITVAASNENDNFAAFSNYGRCVNITAPVSLYILKLWFVCIVVFITIIVHIKGEHITTTGLNDQPTTDSGIYNHYN